LYRVGKILSDCNTTDISQLNLITVFSKLIKIVDLHGRAVDITYNKVLMHIYGKVEKKILYH
tara:strand:+ start:1565 stop:1750 length:186 start_codon:yes stop_codon:yes gene_type:complete